MSPLRILAIPFLVLWLGPAVAAPISIVAAENFCGDIAGQIGGSHVDVVSILSNPDQDPHLFEASPSTARALSGANIVIMNGAGYDPWMARLLVATKARGRIVVNVADIAGTKPGTTRISGTASIS